MSVRCWKFLASAILLNIFLSETTIAQSDNPCPPYSCVLNQTLLKECPIGRFANYTCETSSGVYKKYESHVFFFGKTEKTWSDASADCCQRNMRLLSVENREVRSLLDKSSFIPKRELTIHNLMLYFQPYLPEFKTFWVSAYVASQSEMFWCNAWSSVTNFRLRAGWRINTTEAKTTYGCLRYARDQLDTETFSVNFTQTPCDTTSAYMCVSPVMYMEPEKISDFCDYNYRQEGLISFASNSSKTTNASSQGFLKKGEPLFFRCPSESEYMTIMDQFNITEAWIECCKYGLQLVIIRTKEEIECFSKFLGKTSGYFWTAGASKTEKDHFWRGKENWDRQVNSGGTDAVDRKLWARSQPEDPEFNQVVSLLLEVGDDALTGLHSSHASLRMPIICQFKNQPKAQTNRTAPW